MSPPFKHVPLGRVWELPDAEAVMKRFLERYDLGEVPAYGLRSTHSGKKRRLIKSPLDYGIDWLGTTPVRDGHSVRACKRLSKNALEAYLIEDDLLSDEDVFEDLTISIEDWERLLTVAPPALSAMGDQATPPASDIDTAVIEELKVVGPPGKTISGPGHGAAASDELIYSTGLAGRPSSWNLISAECRRRYKKGERYTNEITQLESSAEWADALIRWLKDTHPLAPEVKKKTLTNKLPGLFRELAATTRPKS